MPRRPFSFLSRARERATTRSGRRDPVQETQAHMLAAVPARDCLTICFTPDARAVVQDVPHALTEVPALVADFLRNPRQEDDKPASPEAARVFIELDPWTPHRVLLAGLEAIRAGYVRLYNERARALFGMTYEALCALDPAERGDRLQQVIAVAPWREQVHLLPVAQA